MALNRHQDVLEGFHCNYSLQLDTLYSTNRLNAIVFLFQTITHVPSMCLSSNCQYYRTWRRNETGAACAITAVSHTPNATTSYLVPAGNRRMPLSLSTH